VLSPVVSGLCPHGGSSWLWQCPPSMQCNGSGFCKNPKLLIRDSSNDSVMLRFTEVLASYQDRGVTGPQTWPWIRHLDATKHQSLNREFLKQRSFTKALQSLGGNFVVHFFLDSPQFCRSFDVFWLAEYRFGICTEWDFWLAECCLLIWMESNKLCMYCTVLYL